MKIVEPSEQTGLLHSLSRRFEAFSRNIDQIWIPIHFVALAPQSFTQDIIQGKLTIAIISLWTGYRVCVVVCWLSNCYSGRSQIRELDSFDSGGECDPRIPRPSKWYSICETFPKGRSRGQEERFSGIYARPSMIFDIRNIPEGRSRGQEERFRGIYNFAASDGLVPVCKQSAHYFDIQNIPKVATM